MMLALAAPGLVERLLVSDIAPVAYPPRYGELVAAMRAVPAGAARAVSRTPCNRRRTRSGSGVMSGWLCSSIRPSPSPNMLI